MLGDGVGIFVGMLGEDGRGKAWGNGRVRECVCVWVCGCI